MDTITVDMGHASVSPDAVGILKDEEMIDSPLYIMGREWMVTCVSMGNPHAVIFLDDNIDALDLDSIGPCFANHPLFSKGVNVEFLNANGKKSFKMRVCERGSGETYACGTGACASVVAGVLNGYIENSVDVKLLGGLVNVVWNGTPSNPNGDVFLSGPANYVFEAELAF